MPGVPKVAIVVLNWNGWEDTRECLESLHSLKGEATVYLVDNGSTDGSPAKVTQEFPWINLVALPVNRGFGGGMNAGITSALEDNQDLVLCLNNDMVVEDGFLEPLVEAARDRVVPYPAIYQYGNRQLIDNLGQYIDLFTGLTRMVGHNQRMPPKEARANYTEVPFLPRETLQAVEGWDESYFAFYEDADLGLRLHEAGWSIRCVPESRVYHKRGRTAGRIPGLVSYYSVRNRLKVVGRHGTSWQYMTTLLHLLLFTLPYIGLRRVLQPGYRHSFRHVLLGLLDSLLPWRREIGRSWTLGASSDASRP